MILEAAHLNLHQIENFYGKSLKDFPWLTYDFEANRKFCKFCRDNTTFSDSSSTFVSGSQNFKIESVRSHEASTGHIRSFAAAKVTDFLRVCLINKNDCFLLYK